LLLLAAYTAVGALMTRLAGATTALGGRFVFTLVPIAIAYHLAHYLSFLLIQGQLLIPLLSDPFGWGWNLLGTAGYRVDIAVIDARFAWYWAVGAIVAGHVLAVFLAHHVAERLLPGSLAARRSQYPMMLLMVAYTMVSLWIIAQPIVEGG
ncbi:MAG TPA: fenitrothion hydrolase, partial [Solirubrobacterales bacterium]|nr:fenitrothion hydrolase [Solirubrobacterales bacterium]